MEAETLLALGDALAIQGLQDEARDAWRQASLIFFSLSSPAERRGAKQIVIHKQSRPAPDGKKRTANFFST